MSFRYIKELLCIGAVVFVSGCGSSSGGESSTDTLLEDNTPPVAYDQNFTLSNLELKENTELDIPLKATDKDGDVLSYTIIKYPQHGSLSGDLPTVIYIPDISYVGEDSFVFEVSDGISTARGVIDIVITKRDDSNITSDGDMPQEPIETSQVTEDNTTVGVIDIVITKRDDSNITSDGDMPQEPIETSQVTEDNTTIEDINQTGIINSDSNNTAQSSLYENHKPLVKNQTFTITENTSVNVVLSGSDEDNDSLTYALSTYPTNGTLKGVIPNLVYIPNKDYVGEDSFSYIANDGTVNSKKALITIHILHLNDTPKAVDDNVSVEEDANAVFDVLSNDIDKDDGLDKKSLTLVKQPIYGIAKVVDGKVIYEPYKNYFGYDSLSYTIKDTQGAVSNEAIVNIDVISVNDAPVAVDDSVVLDNIQAVSIDVLKNDFDIDGNQTELKVVSVSQPQFGKSSVSSNLVLYSHTLDSGDTDSFSYTIEDSKGARATANVYIKIYKGDDTQSSDTNSSDTNDTIDTNKAPIAYDDYIKIDEDETVTFELNATDADNDKLEYVLTNSSVLPSHGVIVSQDNNTITYKPNREFAGKEYITFVANDGNVSSNQAVVTIEIASVNDAPVADAGEDKKGVTGDSFVLDGSKSYDVDGEIVSYEWIEDNQTISTQPTFSKLFTTEGVYRISLRVTDDKNATGMDEVVVDISLCNQGCIHPDPTQTVPFQ